MPGPGTLNISNCPCRTPLAGGAGGLFTLMIMPFAMVGFYLIKYKNKMPGLFKNNLACSQTIVLIKDTVEINSRIEVVVDQFKCSGLGLPEGFYFSPKTVE